MINPHLIKTVFYKELKEIWRDKKTLFWIVLSPMFLYPFMIVLVGQFMGMQKNKIDNTLIPISINYELKNTELYDSLKANDKFLIKTTNKAKPDTDSLIKGVFIYAQNSYSKAIKQDSSVLINIYYDKTNDYSTSAKNKIENILKSINDNLLLKRLSKFNYNNSFIKPIDANFENIASKNVAFGSMIGKILPGIIMFFIFLGAVYIAMDLTAGEKERKTLQSLYAAPIKSFEIIIGKFLPVFAVSISSAIANIIGLGIAVFWQASMAKGDVMSGFELSLSFTDWIWIIFLLIVITSFIAALSMAVLALAKTYKEASSYITPLMMVFIIPMVLYNLPAMEINSTTALIPILNVLLAMTELFKNEANTSELLIVASSSLAYVMLALYSLGRIFSNESVITGENINYKTLLTLEKEERSYFGTSSALLFFAIVLLLFLYIGMPLQTKMSILHGLPLSFILILGGSSVVVMYLFKLNAKKTLQLNVPSIGKSIGTLIMAIGIGFPVSYITSLYVDEQFSTQFNEALKPLFESNIFIGLTLIALFPAIFEELVFRGIIFHGLKNEMKKWGVILISATAFAIMHLSIERLFPTFILGVLLGYILWRGKSIYLTIGFHFLNNGLFFILARKSDFLVTYESYSLELAIVGAILFIVGLFVFNKASNPKLNYT